MENDGSFWSSVQSQQTEGKLTTEQRDKEVNLTIYPQSPAGNESVCACRDGSCVFNASLLGGMGMRLLSGSGHIQYRGITPGSSEEMRILSSPLSSVSLRWIKQIRHPKCLPGCNVCLSLLAGRKSRRRLEIGGDWDEVNSKRCQTALWTKWVQHPGDLGNSWWMMGPVWKGEGWKNLGYIFSIFRTIHLCFIEAMFTERALCNLLVPERWHKLAVLAAVLVLSAEQCHGGVAPLMWPQTLHGHEDTVALSARVTARRQT